MILHFLSDDKFSDYVISQFSGTEMCSEFVLMSGLEVTRCFQNVDKVVRVNPNDVEDIARLVGSLGHYSAVVLHGLFFPWCETVLRNVPNDVKVAWVFWGGEIYGRKDLKTTFLAPKTKFVFHVREMKNILQRKQRVEAAYELPKELFQRINYCLTDIEEEYDFAVRYLSVMTMNYHWYNYYSIEETIGSLRDYFCEGKNIIIGNSCTIENNFFDIFRELDNVQLSDREIMIPLSYGTPWLRNLIQRLGRKQFGDCFIPLVDFMPREQYNRMMLACSTMIQPHYRAQAQGNIITVLWLGMRVYLSEKNIAYSYFKRIGVRVFSIETDLKKDNPKAFAPLSTEEVQHNRSILESWYSKDVMRSNNVELMKLLS